MVTIGGDNDWIQRKRRTLAVGGRRGRLIKVNKKTGLWEGWEETMT